VGVVVLGESLQLRLLGHGLPSLPPEGAALGVGYLAGCSHISASVHGIGQGDQQRPPLVSGAMQQGGVLAARASYRGPAGNGLLDILRRDARSGRYESQTRKYPSVPGAAVATRKRSPRISPEPTRLRLMTQSGPYPEPVDERSLWEGRTLRE